MSNKQESKPKKIINRAEHNRPNKVSELRVSPISGPNHSCYEKGHEYQFLRFDRYGICVKCGDEILT